MKDDKPPILQYSLRTSQRMATHGALVVGGILLGSVLVITAFLWPGADDGERSTLVWWIVGSVAFLALAVGIVRLANRTQWDSHVERAEHIQQQGLQPLDDPALDQVPVSLHALEHVLDEVAEGFENTPWIAGRFGPAVIVQGRSMAQRPSEEQSIFTTFVQISAPDLRFDAVVRSKKSSHQIEELLRRREKYAPETLPAQQELTGGRTGSRVQLREGSPMPPSDVIDAIADLGAVGYFRPGALVLLLGPRRQPSTHEWDKILRVASLIAN